MELTLAEVELIRLYAEAGASQRRIAQMFGVARTTVQAIVDGRWKGRPEAEGTDAIRKRMGI